MKPYWESKLTVTEAQNFSENGIAIFGNPAMRDIIWDKNSSQPMGWINKGYKPLDSEKFRNRLGWVPDKPTKEYDMTNEERYADYKWIKVKRYTMDESKSWEDRYKSLDEHHLKETTFLIDEVRKLGKQLDEIENEKVKALEEELAKKTASEAILRKRQLRADMFRTFFVMWFGFAFIICFIVDSFIDKATQFKYNGWILGGMMGGGFVLSLLYNWFKWKKGGYNA